MQALLERAYRRLGPNYLRVSLLVLLPAGFLVGLFGYAIMALYIDMSMEEFVLLLAAEEVVWVVDALIALRFALPRIEPTASWLRGEQDTKAALAAWRAAASLPRWPLR